MDTLEEGKFDSLALDTLEEGEFDALVLEVLAFARGSRKLLAPWQAEKKLHAAALAGQCGLVMCQH
jgi:hypothetical protein